MYFAAYQSDDFMYRVVDIKPVLPRWRFLDQRANPGDNFAGSMTVCNDQRGRLTRFLQVMSGKPAQASAGVVDHGGERLIDFMSNRRSHLSQRCHSRNMGQLRLRLLQRLFRSLALGHVAHDPTKEPLVSRPHLGKRNIQINLSSVLVQPKERHGVPRNPFLAGFQITTYGFFVAVPHALRHERRDFLADYFRWSIAEGLLHRPVDEQNCARLVYRQNYVRGGLGERAVTLLAPAQRLLPLFMLGDVSNVGTKVDGCAAGVQYHRDI